MYIFILLRLSSCFIPSSTELIKPPLDKNEYKLGTLNNGIVVLLVCNPRLQKVAFSLGVAVGSSEDPVDIPGVSQMVKHMLGYTTKPNNPGNSGPLNRYPISRYCSYKFYTHNNYSMYTVSEIPRHINSFIDLFVATIAAPALDAENIKTEVNRIDMEFKLQCDRSTPINKAVLQNLLRTNKILIRTGCGNAKTLNHPNITEEVQRLWEKHYVGQKMCLVITSPFPFEYSIMLADKFERIRSDPKAEVWDPGSGRCDTVQASNLLASLKNRDCLDFKPEAYKWIYKTKSKDPFDHLFVSVFLPSFKKFDKSVPLSLLNDIIRNATMHMLTPYLNYLGLASSCFLHIDVSAEHTHLCLQFPITKLGAANYGQILKHLKTMLRRVKLSDQFIDRWVEKKRMSFNNLTNEDVEFRIPSLCKRMLFVYPPTIYSGMYAYLAKNIRKELCEAVLSYIADCNNWLIVLMEQDYQQQDDDEYASDDDIYYRKLSIPSCLTDQKEATHTKSVKGDNAPLPLMNTPKCTDGGINWLDRWRCVNFDKEDKEIISYVLEITVQQKYVCISILLMEMARLEILKKELKEHDCVQDMVNISISHNKAIGVNVYLVKFETNSTKNKLYAVVNRFIKLVNKPKMCTTLDTAKLQVLSSFGTNNINKKFAAMFAYFTQQRIETEAQVDCIALLTESDMKGLTLLSEIGGPYIKVDDENNILKCTGDNIALPNYENSCNLPQLWDIRHFAYMCKPVSSTIGYTCMQYYVYMAHRSLEADYNVSAETKNPESSIIYLYNVFLANLLVLLFKSPYNTEVCSHKLHTHLRSLRPILAPSTGAAWIVFSVQSMHSVQEQQDAIYKFITGAEDTVKNMEPDLFCSMVLEVINKMHFDNFVKETINVRSGKANLEEEVRMHKEQLFRLATQEKVASFCKDLFLCERRLIIPQNN